MYSQLFESILIETKVNPIRHHSYEEACAVVDCIKDSIKKYKFKILNRDKNLDFMHEEHINEQTSKLIIEKFLQPKNMVAVLENRNNPNEELYLFSVTVPLPNGQKKYIYLKVALTKDGKVTAISWHKQNELMRTDYRHAEDGDAYFLEKLGKTWEFLYNKIAKGPKIIHHYYEGDCIYFNFEEPVSEEDTQVVQDVVRSVPKDFGYNNKDIYKNIKFEHGDIKIFCRFGHF